LQLDNSPKIRFALKKVLLALTVEPAAIFTRVTVEDTHIPFGENQNPIASNEEQDQQKEKQLHF
jgi:hypothetical protein